MSKEMQVHKLLLRMHENEFLLRETGFIQGKQVRRVMQGFDIEVIDKAIGIFNDRQLWSNFIFVLAWSNDSL
jgi:hypothetical protein